MLNNIMQLQSQLQNVDDTSIRRALSSPNEAVPQFLLMMEMKRRQDLRGSTPEGPVQPKDMRSEMALGMYKPVPSPPVAQAAPANSGILSGMSMPPPASMGGQVTPQAPQGPVPQQLDLSKPAGIGSLFGARR